jgi:putative pyruvate formate lyase activating enzyme
VRELKQGDYYSDEERQQLEDCILCPRECRINRFKGGNGYCGMDAGLNISSICNHRGEEPVISGTNGICNVFFAGCNMHCIYCQNHEISRSGTEIPREGREFEAVLDRIEAYLAKGANSVGFVSPSHVVPQVKAIIRGLHQRGMKPTLIFNTNSYDKPETLRSLSEMVDVYLPDYKYVTEEMALRYSDTYDYPMVALRALKEMYWQKGSSLLTDENGTAERGMLIRHLVLPGYSQESIKVLESIAEELSPGVHLSLMSQYHPVPDVGSHPELNRSVYREEYYIVVEAMERLGFRNGYIQDLESYQTYRPDFSREEPFE